MNIEMIRGELSRVRGVILNTPRFPWGKYTIYLDCDLTHGERISGMERQFRRWQFRRL